MSVSPVPLKLIVPSSSRLVASRSNVAPAPIAMVPVLLLEKS